MRPEQIEAWVVSIVNRVAAGGQVEDSRVELKADWPDPKQAARRIAGHGNAADSDHVLWIIGLNEAKGVVPAKSVDLADWLPQLIAEFDGIAPSLKDLVVPTSFGPVVALLFDVSRRPFVVRNPVFGQTGGGAVSLEVPWRSGTAVRTARRHELLSVLVPRQVLPSLEILALSTEVNIYAPRKPGYGGVLSDIQLSEHLVWSFYLELYVTPFTTDLLVLPTHRASLTFVLGSEGSLKATDFRFVAPHRNVGVGSSVLDSSTVTASKGEAVFRGPGLVTVQASYVEAVRTLVPDVDLSTTLTVSPAGSDLTTEASCRLSPSGEQGDHKRRWTKDR